MTEATVKYVPAAELRLSPIQLRPVKRESLEYVELRDSIREKGILTTLLCRPGDGYTEVVDGAYRYSAGMELRIESFPCLIKEMTDREVYDYQVVANALKVETSPVDYARRLWRIVYVDQTLSLAELSYSLNKNIDWTKRMLGLVNLCPLAVTKLEAHHLSLGAAVEIAKLPFDEQLRLIQNCDVSSNSELIEFARYRARHLRQEAKSIRVNEKLTTGEELRPSLRNAKELAYELATPTMAASVIEKSGAKTPIEIWKAALSFALRMDPDSLTKRQA